MIAGPAIFVWPVLVAQLGIFGTAAFALMFAPAALEAYQDEPLRLWRALAVINLALSPLVFMQIASGMADVSWREVLPFVPQILRETTAGRFWLWRFVFAAVLAVVVWWPARPTRLAPFALACSAVLIVLGSLTGHAIDKGAAFVAIYSLHQAAAGIWAGGLVSLLMSARRGADELRAFALRVSTVSAWMVAMIAGSGGAIAFRWLGWKPHLLLDSAYGRALLIKLAMFTPVLLLGAYNRFWQLPLIAERAARTILLRSVAAELILMLAILGWSAILANTPPPH